MMTLGSPMTTAILRGLYTALGTGAITFLITWASVDEIKGPIIAGAVAALTALGFRAGGEGLYDTKRAARHDVRPGDVGW